MKTIEGRATITIEEAATLLGIGRGAAYEAARRGELPVLTFGRRKVVPVGQFLRLLNGEEPSNSPIEAKLRVVNDS